MSLAGLSSTVNLRLPPHPEIGTPGSPLRNHPKSFHDLEDDYRHHGNKGPLVEIIQCWTSGCWGSEVDELHIALVFHDALQRGDEYAVRMLLLHARADPKARGPYDPNLTPLLVASQFGHLDLVHLFWYLVGPSRLGSSLVVAARNGRAALVGFLLDIWGGWTIEEKDAALRNAAWARWDNSVEVLLSRVPYKHEVLQAALEMAVMKRMILAEDETDRLRGIQLGNLTMDEVEADARRRQRSVISQLVDAGANPNGSIRVNLLCLAISRSDYAGGVAWLLEKGADPNTRRFGGGTPLHCLLGKPLPSIRMISWMRYDQTVELDTALKLLLKHGASPSATNKTGETPLHLVARNGTLEQLKLCLSYCRVMNPMSGLLNDHGESLLHYAAAEGNEEIVKFLLSQEDDRRVDVNLASRSGWTPLLCALSPSGDKSEYTARRMADVLLTRGADARIVTDERWSPLHALASWSSWTRSTSNTQLVYNSEARKSLISLALDLIERGSSLDEEPRFLRDLAITPEGLRGVWGIRMWKLAESSCARCGDTEDTRRLEYGGVSAVVADDTTPLAWAIRTNSMDLVQVFLDRLAKIYSEN